MKRSSVRQSVCLSYRSTTGAACGGFAAERSAGRRYRTIAGAGAQQHGDAARRIAANAGSAMLTAELTRLNTDTLHAVSSAARRLQYTAN